MVFPFVPPNPINPFDAAQQLNPFQSGNPSPTSTGFEAQAVPSFSGWGTRQARIANNRPAVSTRKTMCWLIPEGPIVNFYVNPQNVSYNYKKAISQQRTKGGFSVQYWGEELTTLRLSGTTGTSGIEGINVLYDVYRNEQLAIDPFALFLAAQTDTAAINGGAVGSAIGDFFGGGDVANTLGGIAGGILQAGAEMANPQTTRPKPSLAMLACTVELYWSGEVYRGFFTSFTVTESADQLGLFNYDIDFTVTQKRGLRQNFMPWHRSAVNGPSNSDPRFGRPYTFGALTYGEAAVPRREPANANSLQQNVVDTLSDIANIF